jgi:DNA-binding MarR family transcriptional regulator
MKSLVDIVSKLSNLFGQSEEAAKEQFHLLNLTHTQMHYLETISLLNNPNITELARSLKLTKPTVKVAVDKFIEKDFLYKMQSDEDRRSTHLHMTEKGELINQMHDYYHKRIAESFKRKLNTEELETLVRLLDMVLSDK